MPVVFPASELDDAKRLLALIGSFWSNVYHDGDFVASLLHARAQVEAQAQLDFAELLAAVSRFTVHVFHTDNWYFLRLAESEKNATGLAEFDGTYTFQSGLDYDVPVDTAYYAWAVPDALVDARVVLNAVTGATVVLTQGVDFFLTPGVIRFREDPFTNERIAQTDVFENGVVVDRVCGVWVYRGQWDWETVYRQFGYAVADRMTASFAYRDFVNTVFDGLVEGTTRRTIEGLFAALADVALARGTETVEVVAVDARGLVIVTDRTAYRFTRGSTPLVLAGDVVEAGDALVDTVRFFDLNRGQVPEADVVRALAVGRGLLAEGYFQDLVFENKTVPLIVETDAAGYTRVSFEIGGFIADIEKFWDDTHAAGIAAGSTLAMLLDQRTNKTGQPTAKALPATINPFGFLCQNVLRNNAYLVRLKPTRFGPNAPGMTHAKILRKLVPPHTVCIVLVELEADTDTITMDRPGDETTPGYTEVVTTFQGMSASDTIDPLVRVTEAVKCYQIRGRCE